MMEYWPQWTFGRCLGLVFFQRFIDAPGSFVRTDGNAVMVIALACIGGVALAIQNLLLSAMVARGLNHITALAVNSALGVLLLVLVNFALYGPGVAGTVPLAWV